MKNPQTDIVQVIIQDLEMWSTELKKFLVDNGVNVEGLKFKGLIDAVKKLKVRLITEEYAGLVFDSNGYIVKAFLMDDFVNIKNIPLDVDSGYYKFVDNKIVLDEERQRQIEEV